MRVVAALVGLSVLLVAAEAVARHVRFKGRWNPSRGAVMIADRLNGIPKYRYSPTRHFELVPGSVTYSQHFDLNELVEVRVNSHGLRGPEVVLEKPEGVLRIGWFGDSFVEGVGLEERYTMARQLENLYALDPPGRKVEVLNFGNSGYSIDQQLVSYLEKGRDFGLDIVICTHYDNDLSELDINGLVARSPEGLAWSRGTVKGRSWWSGLALYEFYEDLIGTPARSKSSLSLDLDDSLQLEASSENVVEMYSDVLGRFRDVVVENGGAFYSVVLRNRATLFSSENGREADVSLMVNSLFCRMNEHHRIPYLDMVRLTKDLTRTQLDELYFVNDTHLGEFGNWFVAVKMREFLSMETGVGSAALPDGADDLFRNPVYMEVDHIYSPVTPKAHIPMLEQLGESISSEQSEILFGSKKLSLTRVARSRIDGSPVCMAIVRDGNEPDPRKLVSSLGIPAGTRLEWRPNTDAERFWNDFSRPIIYYHDEYAVLTTGDGDAVDLYVDREGGSVKFRLRRKSGGH